MRSARSFPALRLLSCVEPSNVVYPIRHLFACRSVGDGEARFAALISAILTRSRGFSRSR